MHVLRKWIRPSLAQTMTCRLLDTITNADILSVGPYGTYSNEILFEIQVFIRENASRLQHGGRLSRSPGSFPVLGAIRVSFIEAPLNWYIKLVGMGDISYQFIRIEFMDMFSMVMK